MGPPRIGLIGAGEMGANHARVVSASPSAELHTVIDQDLLRAQALASQFGGRASTDEAALDGCDAVVIASATESHMAVAMPLLKAGLPMLIEKPIAVDLEDVESIVDEAERSGIPLMCGFVERFNPALSTALSLVDEPVLHLNTTRHSPSNPRSASNVILDLLIHDLDLALRIADSYPKSIGSVGWTPSESRTLEIADALLGFDDGMVASLSASRQSQRKIREVRIATENNLFEVDLVRHDVTVYRHVRYLDTDGDGRGYRAETIIDIPFVRQAGEPLALQFMEFLRLLSGEHDIEVERSSLLAPHRLATEIVNDAQGA